MAGTGVVKFDGLGVNFQLSVSANKGGMDVAPPDKWGKKYIINLSAICGDVQLKKTTPRDGDGRPDYVLVDVNGDASLRDPDQSWRVQDRRTHGF